MRVFPILSLLIAVSIFSFNACKERNSESNSKSKISINGTSAKVSLSKQLDKLKEELKADLAAKLNIGTIEKGYHGIQIRLYKFFRTDSSLLIVFTKDSNAVWSGKFIRFNAIYNSQEDSMFALITKVENKEPVSGWELFANNLIKMGILQLPNFKALPQYDVPADGELIIVEYAVNSEYRTYEYPYPEANQERFESAKKMVRIGHFIKQEFKYDEMFQ
jgi:hypothetical protein